MATLKFYYRSKKSNASITARLKHTNVCDLFINTQLRIDLKDWDSKKNLPKTTSAKLKQLKYKLIDLERSLIDSFDKDFNGHVTINKEWLTYEVDLFFKRIVPKNIEVDSFLLTDNIDELIKTAPFRPNGKGSIGLSKPRINQFKGLKKIIEEFQKESNKKYQVKDVNKKFALNFLNFLMERNYAVSYQQKKLSDIKVVCNNARSNGVEVSRQLGEIKITNVTNNYINNEIELIQNLTLTNPALNNARKWILMGCHTGQRGNDLVHLTEKNLVVRNGRKYIEVKQEKTGKPVVIPLHNRLEKIIEDGFPYHLNINGQNGLNKRIKQIGKLAGMDNIIEGKKYDSEKERFVKGMYPKYELMRTHDLRRSFATNLYGKIPTPVIMAITGHGTEQMLFKYIGKTSQDYADQLFDYYDKDAKKETLKAEQLTNKLKAI